MTRLFEQPQPVPLISDPISSSASDAEEPFGSLRERFRVRFGQITRITRGHRHSRWIQRPEFESLYQLSNEGLDLSRLIAQALSKLGEDPRTSTQSATIDQLLWANEQLLMSIDTQLQLIESTLRMAGTLQPLLEGMLRQDGFPAIRLARAVEDFAAEVSQHPVENQIPRAGVNLERILAAQGWPWPWFHISAIQNLRWVALSGPGFAHLAPDIQRQLLVATLLADLGQLAGTASSRSRHRPAESGSLEYRFHPSLSAAMIAGLRGGSSEWARLAAQHHERLDGSGFPGGLTTRALSSGARCVAAIIRWGELTRQSLAQVGASDPLASSAAELWRETRLGRFDAEIVTRLLSQVRTDLGANFPASDRRPHDFTFIDPAHSLGGPVFPATLKSKSPALAAVTSREPDRRR